MPFLDHRTTNPFKKRPTRDIQPAKSSLLKTSSKEFDTDGNKTLILEKIFHARIQGTSDKNYELGTKLKRTKLNCGTSATAKLRLSNKSTLFNLKTSNKQKFLSKLALSQTQTGKAYCMSRRTTHSKNAKIITKYCKSDQTEIKKNLNLISSMEELSYIRIRKQEIEEIIKLDIPISILIDCFVRVRVLHKNGMLDYKVGQIKDVYYEIGNRRNKLELLVRIGAVNRFYSMQFISNQNFKQEEFQSFLDSSLLSNTPLPSINFITEKNRQLKLAFIAGRKNQLILEQEAALRRKDFLSSQKLPRQIEVVESRNKIKDISTRLCDTPKSSAMTLNDYVKSVGLNDLIYFNE